MHGGHAMPAIDDGIPGDVYAERGGGVTELLGMEVGQAGSDQLACYRPEQLATRLDFYDGADGQQR